MKILTLIIHTNVQQDLADHLRSMSMVSGFTLSHAEGHGTQADNDPFLSARDRVVGYTPRVRVDAILQDADVDTVLNELRSSSYGVKDQSIYWVTTVEQSGYL